MEKDLREMDNRELFLVSTGSRGVVLKARLQRIVQSYLRHAGRTHLEEDDFLDEIVKGYYEGKYDD